MAISTIYHVSHTLPEALTLYLESNSEAERDFAADLTRAYSGNVASGANSYGSREEWAEFHSMRAAENADRVARRVIATWHTIAIRKGF